MVDLVHQFSILSPRSVCFVLIKSEEDSDIHFVNIENSSFDREPSRGGRKKQTHQLEDNLLFQRRDSSELRSKMGTGPQTSDFIIPELPSGKVLMLNILSTWGDPSYVGLMGLDVFNKNGQLIRLSQPERQLWADPPDINVLPEYGKRLLGVSIFAQDVMILLC